ENVYESKVYSFTKDIEYTIKVSKDYINSEDKVLIIDDFLASGSAMSGLIDIVEKSGATIEGIGIVIEKEFQKGREIILNKGMHLESLAIIKGFENNKVVFR
ncbi:xanthine phosphoribosyltransferase, partial [Coprococcus sp. MSK.21.13]|nr:xanthine phosphoribosyltransferase [Bacteroidales bacterium MSK.15.36]NSJ93229.1 xanthine phosphoribosyltransferase [Coprococcus sp. MSK.21.13]